jgi:cell division protein FtsI/penicillin-binding protein 2
MEYRKNNRFDKDFKRNLYGKNISKASPFKTVNLFAKKTTLYLVMVVFISVLCLYLVGIKNSKVLGINTFVDQGRIIVPNKGQIYMYNLSLGIPKSLTNNTSKTKLIVNPKNLKSLIESGKFSKEEAVMIISSLGNVNKDDILKQLNLALQNSTNYYVLNSNLEPQATVSLRNIINSGLYKSSDYVRFSIDNWLSYEDTDYRSYPMQGLFGSGVGYVSNSLWSTKDIVSENRCPKLIENNIDVQKNSYSIGLSGMEAKFCSELYGKNGVRGVKQEVNGSDIFLTLDYNLQQKAEEINNKLIINNTNNKGKPKNATTIVVEVNAIDAKDNGRILAMASSPNYDPNNYSNEFSSNPKGFSNYASDVAYENGSVIKPLFTAAILNEFYKAKKENPNGTCENDKRLCVGPAWTFRDTCGGKILKYPTETITIKNYYDTCFSSAGNIGIKDIIRDSINTGITEMSGNIQTETLANYYQNIFGFGKPTGANLYNEAYGNTKPLGEKKGYNIDNAFFGFGQGFTNTPLQLIQAYIPLVTNGYGYPLKVVDKIGDVQQTVQEPVKVLEPEAVQATKSYLIATSTEGNRGVGSKLELEGYGNGSKTGTAQIASSEVIKDSFGQPLLGSDGKEQREWCNYDCNSKKGLYEFTLIGFAPANKPRFLILTKVSEPRPNETERLGNYQVQKKEWLEMTQFTLEYMGVAKQW